VSKSIFEIDSGSFIFHYDNLDRQNQFVTDILFAGGFVGYVEGKSVNARLMGGYHCEAQILSRITFHFHIQRFDQSPLTIVKQEHFVSDLNGQFRAVNAGSSPHLDTIDRYDFEFGAI